MTESTGKYLFLYFCSPFKCFLKQLKSIGKYRRMHERVSQFESLLENKYTLCASQCCIFGAQHSRFEFWKQSIIRHSSVSITPNRALIVLARNTDSHTEKAWASIRNNSQCPETSKKGSSSFEDPLYFIITESIFTRNHYKKLWFSYDMEFWISFHWFETDSVCRSQWMTSFLTTTFEDISSICRDWSLEETVSSKTFALLEFCEHKNKLTSGNTKIIWKKIISQLK